MYLSIYANKTCNHPRSLLMIVDIFYPIDNVTLVFRQWETGRSMADIYRVYDLIPPPYFPAEI